MAEQDPQSEEKSQTRSENKLSGKDITPVLKGWDYEAGTINVRKINGTDGHPKLQMRLDLGYLPTSNLYEYSLSAPSEGLVEHFGLI